MTTVESAGLGVVIGVLVLLPFLVASRRGGARERAARREQEQIAAGRAAEVLHLAQVVLPAVAERARGGQQHPARIPSVLGTSGVGEDFATAVKRLHSALCQDEGARYERTLRDSVQSAYESVARTMHAMATVQQGVLDDIGRNTQDPALMGKVMRADHAAAQMIHKAQTLLVMSGIWPARRETSPVSLYDCVRGAQSRIIEFSRVEVHGGQNLYLVAPAVEGLMHVLAELCQNATTFSPPSTSVIVTFREVGAGVVIQIDDASLGMAPDVLERAVTSIREELEVAQLGAMPRLGLACVGRWARELGLAVDLSGASAYGGIRATVFIPHQLLTESGHTPPAGMMTAGPSAAVTLPEQRTGSETAGGTEGRSGLPQRRARRSRGGPAPATGEAVRGPAGSPAPLTTPPPPTAASSTPAPEAVPSARAAAPSPPAAPAPPDGDSASPAGKWSPQDAGASVAGVVAGTRRGRAQSARASVTSGAAAGERSADPAADPGPVDGAPAPGAGGAATGERAETNTNSGGQW
ncbi:ATP-binding protein [Streptomyces sp. NPDC059740]|uniref:ATP-binding protein n=1 Tax=Streptomyces sp. NPDC059740 TaxID=3346926 RepID=UPI0036612E52